MFVGGAGFSFYSPEVVKLPLGLQGGDGEGSRSFCTLFISGAFSRDRANSPWLHFLLSERTVSQWEGLPSPRRSDCHTEGIMVQSLSSFKSHHLQDEFMPPLFKIPKHLLKTDLSNSHLTSCLLLLFNNKHLVLLTYIDALSWFNK